MKIPTFQHYQQLAAQTAGAGGDDPDLRALVAACGLCGEAAEVYTILDDWLNYDLGNPHSARDELRGELGDVLWYVAEIATVLGAAVEFPPGYEIIEPEDVLHCAGHLLMYAGRVAEMVKKHVGHGKPLHQKPLAAMLREVLRRVGQLGHVVEATLPELAEANIEKLAERWPDGFQLEVTDNEQ